MQYGYIIFVLALISACSGTRPLSTTHDTPAYLIRNPGIQMMAMDPLGSIYLVSGDHRLAKYDTTGKFLYQVSHKNQGNMHSMDASNPFKILVFYRDQQTVIILDNTLSEIQRISLPAWGFTDVTAVCLSADNALWLFDGANRMLTKTSSSGQILLRSDPMDIIRPLSDRPDFMSDTGHELILKERGQPISIFNDFGGYVRSWNVPEGDPVSIAHQSIVSIENTTIRTFDLRSGTEILSLPLAKKMTGSYVAFYAGHFFIADEKGVWKIESKRK